eukprot:TRINITY_DN67367_c0_g1_i1.p1 TRINITY_DN67367_c0_g1~~TRINITY_DN67367_c0_g1_i1.p1  ORF type:complete len:539 (+),score=113.27 TRINITY_DN67367_c0_g1_i1:50-1618(+)
MPQSSLSSADHIDRSGTEEPLSLRRLRESLSNLERLEQQRHELRDRFDSCPGGIAGHSPEKDRTEQERDGGRGREGDRSIHFSRMSSASPRLRSTSPPLHNLGLGNRGGAGTGGVGSATSFGSPRETPWQSEKPSSISQDHSRSMAWVERASPSMTRPSKPQARDSALALALERSQDHIDVLQRERDDALRRAADNETEALRLSMLVEKIEATHSALLDERQRELADVQRLRREHREAMEQLATLRSEAHQSRQSSEEMRSRFERMISEQRQQVESLEESNAQAERELQDRSTRSSDTETALYSCLQERTALLQFVVDLLTALQTLFYDPTPFASLQSGSRAASPSRAGPCGARSASRDLRHRHAGCYACGGGSREPATPACMPQAIEKRMKEVAGVDDLRDLCSALEDEIAQASQAFSSQVQRVLAEAEQSARAINSSAQQPPQQQLRACATWVEQERRRKEKQGLPPDRAVPSVDWNEERAHYQSTTRAMETKFAQLSKLRRLLQARYNAARKKAQAGRY